LYTFGSGARKLFNSNSFRKSGTIGMTSRFGNTNILFKISDITVFKVSFKIGISRAFAISVKSKSKLLKVKKKGLKIH
jgi:hypothetical protein